LPASIGTDSSVNLLEVVLMAFVWYISFCSFWEFDHCWYCNNFSILDVMGYRSDLMWSVRYRVFKVGIYLFITGNDILLFLSVSVSVNENENENVLRYNRELDSYDDM
jgi:hypothetical protein